MHISDTSLQCGHDLLSYPVFMKSAGINFARQKLSE